MGSGVRTNYSHLCVLLLHNSSQSEAYFLLLSHQCFIPFFFPKMVVNHLEGHVPRLNPAGRTAAIQTQAVLGELPSACGNEDLWTGCAHLDSNPLGAGGDASSWNGSAAGMPCLSCSFNAN